MLKKSKIIHSLIAIGTSGKFTGNTKFFISDYFIRYILMNFIILFGTVLLIIFTVNNIKNGSYFDAVSCGSMALIAVITFFLARTKVKQIVPISIITFFYALFCALLTWYGDASGAGVLFIYVYPPLVAIMLGTRTGIILSASLIIVVSLEMFVPQLSHYAYHVDISSRIVASYFLVFSVTFVMENTRKIKDQTIEKQKQKLEKMANELKNLNENLQSMVLEKTHDVIELQEAMLKTIAELVECRDDITGGHVERTQQGIKILLDGLKECGHYSDEINNLDVELILQSCQLHDIGKITIADSILKKPGKLDDEEYTEMKKHAIIGEQIIERIESLTQKSEFLKYAKIFASSHHEKWDGTGYPKGLKGTDIPLLGRIMAIADVYDALISERPYKKAFTHEEAINIIANSKGTHFDPFLIDLFLAVSDKFKE